jgi:AbrB family looped-hinge helix DNA binding protein
MTLRIDKAGRIVVPKPLRERLGLRAGMEIEIAESAEGLMLKPVTKRPSLVQEGRFLVHTGKLPPGYDIVNAIRDDREERMRKLAGL